MCVWGPCGGLTKSCKVDGSTIRVAQPTSLNSTTNASVTVCCPILNRHLSEMKCSPFVIMIKGPLLFLQTYSRLPSKSRSGNAKLQPCDPNSCVSPAPVSRETWLPSAAFPLRAALLPTALRHAPSLPQKLAQPQFSGAPRRALAMYARLPFCLTRAKAPCCVLRFEAPAARSSCPTKNHVLFLGALLASLTRIFAVAVAPACPVAWPTPWISSGAPPAPKPHPRCAPPGATLRLCHASMARAAAWSLARAQNTSYQIEPIGSCLLSSKPKLSQMFCPTLVVLVFFPTASQSFARCSFQQTLFVLVLFPPANQSWRSNEFGLAIPPFDLTLRLEPA